MLVQPNQFVTKGIDPMYRNDTLQRISTFTWLSLVGLSGIFASNLQAAAPPAGYRGFNLTALAVLGDPAPGGGYYTNDFELATINNRGEIDFAADLTTGGEGAFLMSAGRIIALTRAGIPVPGGGTFGPSILNGMSLTDSGEAAFVFTLDPFTFPFGVNAGLFRHLRSSRTLLPLVLPNVTKAPGGGTFAGANFQSMNGRGDIAFAAIVHTDKGITPDLGQGAYLVLRDGRILEIAGPGDPAPGGTIDFAAEPWINESGDVVFAGHLKGEPITTDQPADVFISTDSSLYLRNARSGRITSIVHNGAPNPYGGVFHPSHSILNAQGAILFGSANANSVPDVSRALELYLYAFGNFQPIARFGQPMPGGGKFATTSLFPGQFDLNERGAATFAAYLDSNEHGQYLWSGGILRLIAKTGTVIPRVGTIARISYGSPLPPGFAPLGLAYPSTGTSLNELGQVLFGATLTDGRGVLLLATPKP